MKLQYKKRFKKSFEKLQNKIQLKVVDTLEFFQKSPKSRSLRRHSLKGKYTNYESIDVTGDVRIIIQPQTGEIIDVYDVGTHAELY